MPYRSWCLPYVLCVVLTSDRAHLLQYGLCIHPVRIKGQAEALKGVDTPFSRLALECDAKWPRTGDRAFREFRTTYYDEAKWKQASHLPFVLSCAQWLPNLWWLRVPHSCALQAMGVTPEKPGLSARLYAVHHRHLMCPEASALRQNIAYALTNGRLPSWSSVLRTVHYQERDTGPML